MFLDFLAGMFSWRRRPEPKPPAPPQPPPVQPEWHLALVALHNEARAARGAGPLAAHARLREAAQRYADWLAANRVLPRDHAGPGGSLLGDRLAAAGYGYGAAGENIVANQFVHFGAGRAEAADGTPYWCCVFAAPAKFGASMAVVYVHTPAGIDAAAPPRE